MVDQSNSRGAKSLSPRKQQIQRLTNQNELLEQIAKLKQDNQKLEELAQPVKLVQEIARVFSFGIAFNCEMRDELNQLRKRPLSQDPRDLLAKYTADLDKMVKANHQLELQLKKLLQMVQKL